MINRDINLFLDAAPWYADAPELRGPRSILVVEGDADLREVLVFSLEWLGYFVRAARNGWEALSMLYAGSRPALILLDMDVAVVDGPRFIRMHDADLDIRHIPIVTMSGTVAAADVPTVAKPFRLGELLEAIAPFVGSLHLAEKLN
jgi:CheY-like chemotaxis protein